MPDQVELFKLGLTLYGELCALAVPFAFAIGLGNVIVNTFFSVAFGGRMKIGGK